MGVHISNNLPRNKHIEETCNKAYRKLGLLKRNLHACSEDVKLLAYKGHIRPVKLEYSCAVWDPRQVYLNEKLESVQKRSARFIFSNYDYEQGSMTRILNHLKLEPLKHRRKNSRLTLLFEGLNGKAYLPTCQLRKPMRKSKSHHEEH